MLRQRAHVWQTIRQWIASVPKRNALYVVGDLNCTLKTHLPHVGPGVAHHTATTHSDQAMLQRIVTDCGLTALNTWGKAGRPARTFLKPPDYGVQIDFVLTRLPGTPLARTAHAEPEAPVVHPTGMRHVPVLASVALPSVPSKRQSQHWKAREIQRDINQNPQLVQAFQQRVATQIGTAPTLNDCLEQAWHHAKHMNHASNTTRHTTFTPTTPPLPVHTPAHITLKDFWACKQHLRNVQERCHAYCAPLLWMISDAAPSTLHTHHPAAVRSSLGKLFQLWKAQKHFNNCNKHFRQRTKANKLAKVDQLIAETTKAAQQGYSGLHQLINQLRPKAHRRSTHFRHPTGDLMSPQEELQHVETFFKQLYASDSGNPGQWMLHADLCITEAEVLQALQAMPANKALPRHQAPAVLWRTAAASIVPALCQTLNCLLKPGPLHFPERVLTSYLVLLAKPGKPPTKPSNLRPINLLPAEAKILARIAAERLRPLLASKLESIPQFAYTGGRQTGDAIDRVMTHCQRVRSALQAHQHNLFDKRSGKQRQPFAGGLQLSLDLKQAFDRIPRKQLLSSLEQLDIPTDLISLILYIHDYAKVVIERPFGSVEVCMCRGIRQGCGLAPLLWLAYTIVIHRTLATYIPVDSLTEYADDLHVQWEFQHPRDFRRACVQIPKILQDLEQLGMLVSVDKTVVLLAMKGSATQQLLQDFTVRSQGERFLLLRGPFGKVRLPIRTHHTYLGVRIGYHTFERATVQLRASQAWTAFHRLHPFLKNTTIPLKKRLQLWSSGVWPVLSYGLSSVGLDHVSAAQINQLVLRQLRMVARSPPHITRETNLDLLSRLRMLTPMQMLQRLCQQRNNTGRQALTHLQPEPVQQWWTLVTTSFGQPEHQLVGETIHSHASLTEVTQIQRFQCSCPTCGQSFPSTHALSVHIGKQHPETRPPKLRSTKAKNRMVDSYRQHARDGLPQCVHCAKRFYGWPQFMGHFSQQACPVVFFRSLPAPQPKPQQPTESPMDESSSARPAKGASAPGSQQLARAVNELAPQPEVPVFCRPELQTLAKAGDLHGLAAALRKIDRLHYCPQCNQWIANTSYVARHACKMHPELGTAQPAVLQWIKQRGRLSSPCEWCHCRYDRASAHIQACVVLWTCAHMLHAQHKLLDTRQRTLQDVFGRQSARGSQAGAQPLLGLHAAGQPAYHGPLVGSRCEGPGGERDGAHGRGQGQARTGAAANTPRAGAGEVCQGRGERANNSGLGEASGLLSADASSGPSSGCHGQGQQAGFARSGSTPSPNSGQGQARAELGRLEPILAAEQLGTPAGQTARQPSRRAAREGGGTERAGPTVRTDALENGRLALHSELGHDLHPFPEDGGGRKQLVRHLGALQSRQRMASAQREQPFQPGATDEVGAHALPFGCPAGKIEKDRVECRPASESETAWTGGRRGLPLPAMESEGQKARESPAGAVEPPRGATDGDPLVAAECGAGRGREVPCHAAAQPAAPGGSDPLRTSGTEPQCGVPAVLSRDASPMPLLGASLGGSHDATLTTGPLTIGHSDREDPAGPVSSRRQCLLTLGLSNPSNHCYANSVMYSLMWVSAGLPTGTPFLNEPMQRLIGWLTRKPHLVQLWSVRIWRQMLSGWARPHQQHDTAEFLMHLERVLSPAFPMGYWQARLEVAACPPQATDHGQMWPVTLPTVLRHALADDARVFSVQSLIISWRNQASRHAAVSLPPVVPLQIGRFSHDGSKLRGQIVLTPTIHLPLFADESTRTTSCKYVLQAAIFHLGPDIHAGHYRTVLFNQGKPYMVTDDNQYPSPVTAACIEEATHNAYLVFYCRHDVIVDGPSPS